MLFIYLIGEDSSEVNYATSWVCRWHVNSMENEKSTSSWIKLKATLRKASNLD